MNDPAVKSVAGALFKPDGSGPFPAVIYMSGCRGLNAYMELQKKLISHLTSMGVARLVLDLFTPRDEMEGVCTKIDATTFSKQESRRK